jgi:hypothetical protein
VSPIGLAGGRPRAGAVVGEELMVELAIGLIHKDRERS